MRRFAAFRDIRLIKNLRKCLISVGILRRFIRQLGTKKFRWNIRRGVFGSRHKATTLQTIQALFCTVILCPALNGFE